MKLSVVSTLKSIFSLFPFSIALESTKFQAQHVTVVKNNKMGDVRGTILDNTKLFYAYCKVRVLCFPDMYVRTDAIISQFEGQIAFYQNFNFTQHTLSQ